MIGRWRYDVLGRSGAGGGDDREGGGGGVRIPVVSCIIFSLCWSSLMPASTCYYVACMYLYIHMWEHGD